MNLYDHHWSPAGMQLIAAQQCMTPSVSICCVNSCLSREMLRGLPATLTCSTFNVETCQIVKKNVLKLDAH